MIKILKELFYINIRLTNLLDGHSTDNYQLIFDVSFVDRIDQSNSENRNADK